jgi:hypothetical protein
MATSSPHHDRLQRYTAGLEVHLDQATQTKIKRFVATFRRSSSAVLRHLLPWSLTDGQGWTLDRGRAVAPARRVFLRLAPELRRQRRGTLRP